MHTVTLLALLVTMVASIAMAEDKTVKVDQISVMIKGKSGLMTLTATEVKKEDDDDSGEDDDDATTSEPEPETTTTAATTTTTKASERKRRAADDVKTNSVEVMFVSLKEVDAEGNVVGEAKENSQALDSFAEVQFSFDALKEASTIPNSMNKDNTEIKALEQSFSTNLGGNGMAKIFVYIAKEDGNLTLGAGDSKETTEVKKGQIKFSVHIEGWVWCTEDLANCKKGEGDEETNEEGAALDMVVKVKGKGEATKMDEVSGMAMHFSIGNDNHLFVSKKVMKTATDDTTSWVDMADTYPMSAKDGVDTTKLTMRFAKFEKSMLYDPSVRLMIPGNDETSASNAIVASLGVILMALVAAVLRV